MARILFSFDTEDYINEYGAEGILRLAQIFKEEGLIANFVTVGLMAEALVKWGRQDIIAAMKEHEIVYHSHRHSMHPTINEYTDRADFYGALADFIKDETIGVKKVCDILGVSDMPAVAPPGNSTSYVAHYGYAKMGFPIYSGDDLIDAPHSRPIYACNILTTYYKKAFDDWFLTITEDEMRTYLDQKVAQRDLMIFFHHPQRAYCKHFCDIDNFYGENVPEEKWIESPRYTAEETETFYNNIRTFLRMVKADPRFTVVTYSEVLEQSREDTRVIDKATLAELRTQLDEYFFPVTTPNSYCVADVFNACREMLCGATTHTCGEVYGFLDAPFAITEPVTLQKKHIVKAAQTLSGEGFLPEYIYVDDKKIGPADFMRAALAVLLDGAEEVTVNPGPWQIDMDQFPNLRDYNYHNTWVHCKSLEDKYLSNRFRWQSWTFRLPRGTARKIFE